MPWLHLLRLESAESIAIEGAHLDESWMGAWVGQRDLVGSLKVLRVARCRVREGQMEKAFGLLTRLEKVVLKTVEIVSADPNAAILPPSPPPPTTSAGATATSNGCSDAGAGSTEEETETFASKIFYTYWSTSSAFPPSLQHVELDGVYTLSGEVISNLVSRRRERYAKARYGCAGGGGKMMMLPVNVRKVVLDGVEVTASA